MNEAAKKKTCIGHWKTTVKHILKELKKRPSINTRSPTHPIQPKELLKKFELTTKIDNNILKKHSLSELISIEQTLSKIRDILQRKKSKKDIEFEGMGLCENLISLDLKWRNIRDTAIFNPQEIELLKYLGTGNYIYIYIYRTR